jgi:hypothetical protein
MEYLIGFAVGFVAAWLLKSRLVAPALARQRGIEAVVADLQRTNYRLEEEVHELREQARKARVQTSSGAGG